MAVASAMGLVGNAAWAVAPAVSSYSPSDNSTGVIYTPTLTLTFDQNVTAVAGKNIVIKKTSDNSTAESIAANDTANVTISGSKALVYLTTTLAASSDYYVEVDSGAFKNSGNEDYVGIANATTWNFTTGAGATVVSYSPANGSATLRENANLALSFIENVTAVSGKNIRIYKADGTLVESIAANNTAKVSISTGTVTINPAANLVAGSYYVQIDAGAFTGNQSGVSYAGIANTTTWAFTTFADTTAPALSSLSPVDNSTSISVGSSLTVYFDEYVTATSGKNINIYSSGGTLVESIAANNTAKVSVSGDKVTINPTNDLAFGTGYYVQIDAGAFVDRAATPNPFAGISDSTTWNFTTKSAATVSAYSPTNGATTFLENANLSLTFSESVTAVAGKNIRIYKTDGTLVETIAADASAVTISGTSVSIKHANLIAGSYYIQIDAGAFTGNASGVSYAGIADTTTWAFTSVADTTAPTLSSLSPTDNSINVVTNSSLTAYFNEKVTAASGKNISIYTSTGTLVETIAANNTAIYGTKLTFHPSNALAFGTGYYVQIDAGAFVDTATTPNPFAGISDTTTWNFTTASAATVTAYSPASGATNFVENANLSLTFSENVTAVAGKNIRIYKADGTLVDTISVTNTASVAIAGVYAYIKHVSLAPGSYYIQIDAGAFTGNTSGVSYAGIADTTTWAFTSVADTTAPSLWGRIPTGNASGVALDSNLILDFSENVTAASGKTIRIYRSDGTLVESIAANDTAKVTISGVRATVNPAANLALNTGYYVQIDSGAFLDTATAANSYAGISNSSSWNFTTVAGATATSYSPANGATNFSETGTLYLTLNENVTAVSGKNVKIYKADGTLVETLSVTDTGKVSVSGATVAIKPSATLTSGNYYVQIDAGAFTGNTTGNSYAGIANATTWAFTSIADATAPTVASFSPANGSTNIGLSAHPSITFNEKVKAGSGKKVNIYKSDGTLIEALASDDTAKVSISGATVELKPSQALQYSTGYYVTVDAGAFVDQATTPNAYPGLAGSTAWQFTTIANPNTVVAAGASATVGNTATPVDAGAGSTLNVTQGSSGATINLPSLSSGGATSDAVRVVIGGNALTVKPTENGSVVRTTTVTLGGRDTTVLNVTAGTAQVSASAPNQTLLALGSGANAVLVSAKGTSTTVIANVDRGNGTTSLTLPKPATGKEAGATIKLTIAGKDLSVKPQGSRDTVVTLRTVSLNNQDVQVVAVTGGAATVTATQSNQPLLAIGSGSNAIVVTSSSSTSEATSQVDSASGTTTISVTSGVITLPADAFSAFGNGFSAVKDGKLYAGEVAVLNSGGKVTSVRLGSLAGDSASLGDPLAISPVSGFFIKATIPNLRGKVARLADFQQFTDTLANAFGSEFSSLGQGSDGVLMLISPAGSRNFLPVGEITVDTDRADGTTVTGNGKLEVAKNGLITRFVPVVANREQLVAQAVALDKKATIVMNDDGVLEISINGVTYVMKPGWTAENGDGVPGVGTDKKGRVTFQDNAGNRHTLYPAFADLARLVATFKSYDAALLATGNEDGSVTAKFQGKIYTLTPEYALTAVPAEHLNDNWWTGSDGRLYIKSADGRTAQGFSVR